MLHKLSAYTLPFPTDWAALFGADRPLIVEIGFGNGDYLMALAQHHADCNVVGLEIANRSLDRAERKAAALGLSNVRPVYGMGELALHHLLQPASIRALHINYPDPWFKDRHAGRRIMQRDTLDAIVSRLEVGALFYLATDILAYAEMSHALLAATPGLSNTLPTPWSSTPIERLLTTKYEGRGYQEGRGGHYFCYQRNDHPAPAIPVLRELTMPHAILDLPLTPAEIAEQFAPFRAPLGDEMYAAYHAAFVNQRHYAVLVETSLIEPSIEQHIALMCKQQENARFYTLQPTTLGYPRMTEGMHRAVARLSDYLLTLHPQARLVSHKLKDYVPTEREA